MHFYDITVNIRLRRVSDICEIIHDAPVLKRRAIIAGHKSALTFASQITKMETVRNPNDFGDYIRSLNVYGFKVVKPESLVLGVVA